MSRWHVASCTAPQVYTDQDSIPCCKACGATAHESLAFLKQQQNSRFDSLPAISPDEPMGQLNLHWPPDVPWIDTPENHKAPMHNPAQRRQLPAGCGLSAADSTYIHNSNGPSSNTANTIYGHLDNQQFRLITLESNRDTSSSVVHLELDTYPIDRCPEYETMSYSWGGEDGNSSLCQPIYVGEFWDVLLQTRNCFSMLQYLRPQRGNRTVWIDAICINQADTHERNEQVQMMGQIYSQCNQVFLWLGADLVRPTPGTYPSRLPLQNTSLGTGISVFGKPTTLANILNRRYFSRVWVVQELILAPRVIMPVGNTTFFAHPRIERVFPVSRDHDSSRASSQIPWMEHITRGRVEARGLYEVVGLLGTSQASDARDKVFGVLGLLPSHSDLTTLRPDYSLSQKSVFVGFVARSIFVEGNHFLLHQACGIVGSLDFPSWAPSYHHHLEIAWNRVLDKSHTGQPIHESVRRLIGANSPKMRSEEHRNSTKTWPNDWQMSPYRIVSIGYGGEEPLPVDGITGLGLHTRLHSDTGRLSINLKRVFAIREAPVPIDIQLLQGCRIHFKTERSSVSNCVYLIGPKALHTIVRVGDEVWILETSTTPKVFLVLRKNSEPQTFSLVATCYYVFCVLYEMVPKHHPWISNHKKEVNDEASLFLSVSKMQKQMHSDYAYIRKMFNVHLQIDRTTCRHFLRFVMRASEENGYKVPRLPRRWQSLPERWEELYISSFQSDVESWIDGDYCHVKMQQGSGSLAQFESIGWEVVTRGESTTFRREILQIEKEYKMMLSFPKIDTYLRVCLSICRRTYGDYALRDIERLTLEKTYRYKDWDRWLSITDENSKYLCVDKFMHRLKPYRSSFAKDGLIEGLELDGSQYRVTIV